ncbi:MAG: marine proteobacterial sortase target protein, partial [Alphaproteobacteria bacterium]|nr:marine proteobacterial sortase target protein [Alphaproteobacteria bacterium]
MQDGSGIARLWARRRIDNLEAAAILGVIDNATRDRDILALALEHHLVTRLTSLVAVDQTPMRPEGEPLARTDIPLNLPSGWQFDKLFGPAMDRQAAGAAAMPAPPPSVTLPQTATPAA